MLHNVFWAVSQSIIMDIIGCFGVVYLIGSA